jgi:hypothetical protein
MFICKRNVCENMINITVFHTNFKYHKFVTVFAETELVNHEYITNSRPIYYICLISRQEDSICFFIEFTVDSYPLIIRDYHIKVLSISPYALYASFALMFIYY